MIDIARNDNFKIGLIEGFYGHPWSWKNRFDIVDFLSINNYKYYIYAPKSDRKLREDWDKDWGSKEFDKIKKFREHCKINDIEFGIGLSPYELYLNWNTTGKELLKQKISRIKDLKPDILWILFDDMKGDRGNMADVQIEITHYIKSLTKPIKIAMCPTYYSYDPVLKALFGLMPKNYLNKLGNFLDKDIDIIWTGPEVCSKKITVEHIEDVSNVLQRKPLLWDNYPVNDSPRLTPFLFLNGFDNRPKELKNICSAHTINPMVQPSLTQIPMATLSDLYNDINYSSKRSWNKHARRILGEKLFNELKQDVDDFMYRGVGSGKNPGVLSEWKDKIEGAKFFSLLSEKEKRYILKERSSFEDAIQNSYSKEEKKLLIKKYKAFDCRYSSEIVDWLNDKYSFDPKIFED